MFAFSKDQTDLLPKIQEDPDEDNSQWKTLEAEIEYK